MKIRSGFSLIEVIISAFIMALSILAITGLKQSQANVTQSQLQFYNAWKLMEFKLTDLRSLANSEAYFLTLADDVGGVISSGEIQQSQFTYQLNWRVTDMTSHGALFSVKKVMVIISWKDTDNEELLISDSTLLSVFTNEVNVRHSL